MPAKPPPPLTVVKDETDPIHLLDEADPLFSDIDLFLRYLTTFEELPNDVHHHASRVWGKMITHLREQQRLKDLDRLSQPDTTFLFKDL